MNLRGVLSGKGGRGLPDLPLEMHQNPKYTLTPQYWISKEDAESRIPTYWNKQWLISFRGISSAKLERTVVFSIVPRCGLVDTAPVLFIENSYIHLTACFLANVNSLVFDYVSRQKVAGTHLNYFFVKQFPALPPSAYTPADIAYITPRVLELVYTAYDLKPYAEDTGYYGEPFKWDEVRRTMLRAELDGYYAKLYGLTRDELRYILDPKEVYGEDFPGETFRVLKEKEMRLYGEFRTRRLVLEAWDRLEESGEWRVASGEERVASGLSSATGGLSTAASGLSSPTSRQPSVTGGLSAKTGGLSSPASAQPSVTGGLSAATGGLSTETGGLSLKAKDGKPAEDNPAQTSFSDFGLYECLTCGKRVMGFDQGKHVKEVHGGKSVEWKMLR